MPTYAGRWLGGPVEALPIGKLLLYGTPPAPLRSMALGAMLLLAGACSSSSPDRELARDPDVPRAERLALLGKVWGFARYHHPRITAGDLDWDRELLDVVPLVMSAPDRSSALQVMDDWLRKSGPVGPCDPCSVLEGSMELPPPVDWIRDSAALGAELSGRLVQIYDNRPAGGSQHYISHQPGVGNPRFHNEIEGGDEFPTERERLLGLFHFWNALTYWFPYRDLIDDDLDELLVEFVPEVLGASSAEDYQRIMIRLIARAYDTHSNLWSHVDARPPGGGLLAPLAIRFVENQAVVAGYLHETYGPQTGLEVGDVIVAVDGVPVRELVRQWTPYYAASNDPTRLRDIGRNLLRGASPSVDVTYERSGASAKTSVTRLARGELRAHRRDLDGPAFQLLDPDVAYLKLSAVVADSAASYVARARGTEVFVLDIRNYPSEFMVFGLGGHLVEEPTPFARFTSATASNPGAFTMGPPISIPPRQPFYDGRVVVLVDETSQSQAEYTAMAFRTAPRAIVVGSTTAGADGNVSPISLPGGLRTMISGIGVFYPDGTPTQRIGILPDLVATPTIEGIREGRDEVLEAGVSAALGRAFSLSRQEPGDAR